MNCTNPISDDFEDYLDGSASPEVATRVRAHVERCPACAAQLRELAALRHELARLPAPTVEPEVLERLLVRAVSVAAAPAPRRYRQEVWQRLGLATAAVVLLAVGVGLGLNMSGKKSVEAGPQIVLAAQPIELGAAGQRVGLMFRTADALHDASISVWLPDDVRIAGRPNVRHMIWHADLKAGPNLLELPLEATGSHGGTLVVQLSQGSLVRTLEIPITVRSSKGRVTGSRRERGTEDLI